MIAPLRWTLTVAGTLVRKEGLVDCCDADVYPLLSVHGLFMSAVLFGVHSTISNFDSFLHVLLAVLLPPTASQRSQ